MAVSNYVHCSRAYSEALRIVSVMVIEIRQRGVLLLGFDESRGNLRLTDILLERSA